jgi:hypothetical protein
VEKALEAVRVFANAQDREQARKFLAMLGALSRAGLSYTPAGMLEVPRENKRQMVQYPKDVAVEEQAMLLYFLTKLIKGETFVFEMPAGFIRVGPRLEILVQDSSPDPSIRPALQFLVLFLLMQNGIKNVYICPGCGEFFFSKDPRTKTCSDRCRTRKKLKGQSMKKKRADRAKRSEQYKAKKNDGD